VRGGEGRRERGGARARGGAAAVAAASTRSFRRSTPSSASPAPHLSTSARARSRAPSWPRSAPSSRRATASGPRLSSRAARRPPTRPQQLGPRKIWHFLRPFMIFYDIPDIALLEKPMICVWPLNLSSKRSRCGRPDSPKPLIEHCGFLQQIQTSLVTEKRQSNNW
jgi:hypothetical protein